MRILLIANAIAIVACGRGGDRRAARHDAARAIATAIDAAPAPIDAPGPDAAPPRAGEVIVHAGAGVAAFYLDRTETTVGEYRECVVAGGCPDVPARPDPAPVIAGVSFTNARAYCAWRGKRLPTATEWKRATYRDAKLHYPWGDAAPDCDHAVLDGCAEDVALPPGRPDGASAWGALDMIGNVAEWVDDGDAAPATACTAPPPTTAHAMGGDRRTEAAELDGKIAQTLDREPAYSDDTGIRCARSMTVAGPATDLDPIVAALLGRGWLAVTPVASATAAIAEVASACPARTATAIAGELVGRKGWLVVDGGFATEAAARAAGGDVVAAPTRGLVRVVGTAGCSGVFDPGPAQIRLTTAKPKHRWQFAVPDSGAYQLWLEAGVHATFELICPPPHCTGPDCGPGIAGAREPVEVVVPAAPTPRFEAPPLEMQSGCTCD